VSVVLSLQVLRECDPRRAHRREERYLRVSLPDDAPDADIRRALAVLLKDAKSEGGSSEVHARRRGRWEKQ
jgi:hypothetical protein